MSKHLQFASQLPAGSKIDVRVGTGLAGVWKRVVSGSALVVDRLISCSFYIKLWVRSDTADTGADQPCSFCCRLESTKLLEIAGKRLFAFAKKTCQT